MQRVHDKWVPCKDPTEAGHESESLQSVMFDEARGLHTWVLLIDGIPMGAIYREHLYVTGTEAQPKRWERLVGPGEEV